MIPTCLSVISLFSTILGLFLDFPRRDEGGDDKNDEDDEEEEEEEVSSASLESCFAAISLVERSIPSRFDHKTRLQFLHTAATA